MAAIHATVKRKQISIAIKVVTPIWTQQIIFQPVPMVDHSIRKMK